MRRSSSTSLRDSPCVSTLPQMAPISCVWAASQGSPRAAPRWTAAAAARTDALVRARPCRRRICSATKLPVCWSAGAAQTRTEFTSRIVARVIDPEASGGRPSARSCTIVASAAALLVGRGCAAKAVLRRKDSADAFYDDHRSAARPCHASAAARDPCGPALLPSRGHSVRQPHHWGPELAPRSVRRRDRASTPVHSPVLAPRDSSARRARTRADAGARKRAWAGSSARP